MELNELKEVIVGALEDLKANDIVVMDVHELTSMTDAMIFASGTSSRHVKSIAGNALEEVKKLGHPATGSEGDEVGDWVLVDFGEVILHVMLPETREFYDLEKLWSDPTQQSMPQ